MIVKGILRICKGIFSFNQLTFEDADVTPAVTLKRLTQDHHAGWREVLGTEVVELETRKQMIVANSLTIESGGQVIIPTDSQLVIIGDA